MKSLICAMIIFSVKIFAMIFYRCRLNWISKPEGEDPWRDVRLFVFINHTSLYEPIFFGGMPSRFLWWSAFRVVVPGADKTLKRPIVGTFFKFLAPRMISVSRKRDNTWQEFLDQVHLDKKDMIVIMPEGRMMRANGLDSRGRPMTIRGGVADILQILQKGKMMICYSHGLHHVQVPGQSIPKIFQKIEMDMECLKIEDYIANFSEHQDEDFKDQVIADLERRKALYCPRYDVKEVKDEIQLQKS